MATTQKTFRNIEEIYARYHAPRFLKNDPLSWVRKFTTGDKGTLEIAALIGSAFAYGRVELIQKCLTTIERITGAGLNDFCQSTPFREKQRLFGGFTYRFNDGTDLALLCQSAADIIAAHGSLEALMLTAVGAPRDRGIKPAISNLSDGLRSAAIIHAPARKTFEYLVARPEGGSACKRLNMMARWMVRPDDGIDLGVWTGIKASALIMPVDTHIAHVAHRLKLTARRSPDWRMAEEITTVLRRLSPDDPVKYDFSLCQAGMADFREGR